MDGLKLQAVLKDHELTGKALAVASKKNVRGIYRYFGMAQIKRQTVAKLLATVNISMETYDNYLLTDQVSEPTVNYGKAKNHQGRNLKMLLSSKGVNHAAFATRLNISRQTLYRYFTDKELPAGFIMMASKELNTPIAEIKGFGLNDKSFEKDIYQMLYSMNDRLTAIEKVLANRP